MAVASGVPPAARRLRVNPAPLAADKPAAQAPNPGPETPHPAINARLAGGYCLRAEAQGASPYASICEHCPGFRADPSHLAVLAAQRVDARALAAGADARGWSTEADRHRRLAERLDAPHRPGPGRMTRRRIRQVEQANLHPVDVVSACSGRSGSCCRATCLPPTSVCSSSSTQHLLLQRLGRVRLRPRQHPSEFVNRYRWLLRHDPGLPDASAAARREAGSAAVSLRRRDHASPISGTPPLRTRYTAANPLVKSLEPVPVSALTATQSGYSSSLPTTAAGRQ